MLTAQQKARLEALRKKAAEDLSDAEKTELKELEALAGSTDEDDAPKYTQAYVDKLRADAAKYRVKAKEKDEKLTQYEGIDPEKYQEMLQQLADAEQKRLESKGDWDKLRDQLVDAHTKELSAKDQLMKSLQEEKAKLQDEIHKIILKHEIGIHATVAKAINPELVEMVVMGRVKVDAGENGRTIKVLDAEGKDRLDPKTGEPFTIPQLISEMKQTQQYAHLFEGGTYGTGGKGEYFDGRSVGNPWADKSFNLSLQGQIIQKDPSLARRMIRESGRDPGVYGL